MDSVANLLRDLLLPGAKLIQIGALGHHCGTEIGFGGAVADGQIQAHAHAVGGKSESSNLAESVEQTSSGDYNRHSAGTIHHIAANAVRGIAAGQVQLRLELVIGDVDAGIVVGELLANGFELRTLAHSGSDGCSDVLRGRFSG